MTLRLAYTVRLNAKGKGSIEYIPAEGEGERTINDVKRELEEEAVNSHL